MSSKMRWHLMQSCRHAALYRQSRKFPLPKVRKNRQLDWTSDEEFGRQMLAGQNPCVIFQVTKQWLASTPFTDASIGGLTSACWRPMLHALTQPAASWVQHLL
jgi:hypothetical protein